MMMKKDTFEYYNYLMRVILSVQPDAKVQIEVDNGEVFTIISLVYFNNDERVYVLDMDDVRQLTGMDVYAQFECVELLDEISRCKESIVYFEREWQAVQRIIKKRGINNELKERREWIGLEIIKNQNEMLKLIEELDYAIRNMVMV